MITRSFDTWASTSFRSGDVVADVGVGLPFPDRSADVVVALDVLEHADRIHDSFAELCRVARKHIVLRCRTSTT